MKLLYCQECGDIFNLNFEVKKCSCGKTSGKYIDDLNAVYYGGIPIGFHNQEFYHALYQQSIIDHVNLDLFYGERFTSWVVPENSNTFVRGTS